MWGTVYCYSAELECDNVKSQVYDRAYRKSEVDTLTVAAGTVNVHCVLVILENVEPGENIAIGIVVIRRPTSELELPFQQL